MTDVSVERRTRRRRREKAPATQPLSWGDRVACLGVTAVFAVFQLMLGANFDGAALAQALVMAGLLVTLAIAWRHEPADESPTRLRAIVALFAALCLWCLFQTMPLGLSGDKAAWSVVGQTPSISINRGRTLIEIAKLMGAGCAFGIGALIARSPARLDFLMHCFIYWAGLYGAWAIVTFYRTPDLAMGFLPKDGFFPDRLTASLFSPNTAGAYFGAMLILAVAAAANLARRERLRSVALGWLEIVSGWLSLESACALICLIALLLTASRNAIAATIAASLCGLVYMTVTGKWSLKVTGTALLAGLLLGLALAPIFGQTAANRFLRVAGEADVRIATYQTHLPAIKMALLPGHGIGSFDDMNRNLSTAQNAGLLWDQRAMHNVDLQEWEGIGLVGAVLVTALIALNFIGSGRGKSWPLNVAVCLALIAFFFHGQFDYALEVPWVLVFVSTLMSVLSNRNPNIAIKTD